MSEKHILSSAREAPLGSIISFIYASGSMPGSLRKIKVSQIGSTYIRGEDQDDNNQIKTFSELYIRRDIEILSWPDEEVVEPHFCIDGFFSFGIINSRGEELIINVEENGIPQQVAVTYSIDGSDCFYVNPKQLTEYLMIHLGITK